MPESAGVSRDAASSGPAIPTPPPVSPDGRWWWNGQSWQPMPTGAPAPPPANVFCRTCGASVPAHAVVCLGCGAGQAPTPQSVPWSAPSGPQPKSSGLAVLFTILWPGAGHMYLGNTSKGTPYVVANAIGFVLWFTVIFIPIAIIIWIATLCATVGGITSETEQYNLARFGRPS